MKHILASTLLLFTLFSISAQDMLPRYEKANQYVRFNIKNLVKNPYLNPHWIDNGSDLWFYHQNENGYEFLRTKKGKTTPAFDHQKVANTLSQHFGTTYSPDSLPFSQIDIKEDNISFKVDTTVFVYSTKTGELSQKKKKEKTHFESNTSKSPDGKWLVTLKNHNLYLSSTDEDSTQVQLTTDGIELFDYSSGPGWSDLHEVGKPKQKQEKLWISWTSDSKHFYATKLDRRNTKTMYLMQYCSDDSYRAKVWEMERFLPVDTAVNMQEHFIFDVENNTSVKIDLPPYPAFLTQDWLQWSKDNTSLYFSFYDRGYGALNRYFISAETGKIISSIRDESPTMIETQLTFAHLLEKSKRIILSNESSGYNELYLYNSETGNLINPITQGEFVVRKIAYVDEKSETIWFVACGKEEGDPYYQYLYKINFDGSGLKLLTSEYAEHETTVSPDGTVFVDNYSRCDFPTISVLRSMKTGKIISELQKCDATELLATGWNYPEPFVVKARDGETDIYGVIFKPSDFDENKTYHVIDGTYSGPQAVRTPKSFRRSFSNDDVPLAELGFIVVTIDGMGSAMRSKAFHDVSWENLGDIGAPDHMSGIRQLAEKYSWMDIADGVGIYGHSAGGYDAAHAILAHPDFYSVAVSSAGNHDQRMAKVWWPEQYQGKLGPQYEEQSSINIAQNLKGHLLLAHGDMDDNVNPACTMKLVDALIKNNKDFDLLFVPNNNHGSLAYNPYFWRKRWDYFVKNLMNKTPPKGFKIE